MGPSDAMDVTCPACAARYVANDEKLRGKTARMRCKACNTAWTVTGPTREPAPATSPFPTVAAAPAAKVAAIAKTGKEREKRDLFAPRDVAPETVKETLLPPPSSFGARNESSVLFSLDQLSKSSRAPTPPLSPQAEAKTLTMGSGAGFVVSDEEGVIDLKALSSMPPRPPAGPVVAPLFSEPAPMAIDIGPSSRPQGNGPFSSAQLLAGLAAAAAILVVAMFAVVVSFRGEEPVKHLTAAAPIRLPASVVAPPKVEPPPAAAQPEAAPPEDEPKTTAKGKAGKARAGKGSSFVASKTSAPAPRPVKAADPCHCKGNFNCILACTAKGGK